MIIKFSNILILKKKKIKSMFFYNILFLSSRRANLEKCALPEIWTEIPDILNEVYGNFPWALFES